VRRRDLDTLEYPRILDAIAAHARSAAGRDRVRALEPTADHAEVVRRLEIVDELIALTGETTSLPLGDVPRIERSLAAASPLGTALECEALAEIRDLLETARSVRRHLARDPLRFPSLGTLADAIPDPSGLLSALRQTLDERGQVREDASPALAAARAATREIRAEIEARLTQLVRDPDLAGTVGDRYVTLRNGRYVVPIKQSAAWTFPGVVQDRSGSEETVFVEPLFAVALNNRLILASKTEEIEERRVRTELTDLVRTDTDDLRHTAVALAEMDCFGATAAFAIRYGCTRPLLGADHVELRGARHPLLATGVRPVVPVDVRVPAGCRGLAITGPNAGGKTVALKSLGLAVLMAQSGLFVFAAEGSALPLFDAVLADIGDEQSIDHDLSTFTGRIVNLAAIAEHAGAGALVLLDEPGAGTDPVEGAAIAVGVLTDLSERGPTLVFTTHFPQVKTFALGSPALEVAAFDVDPESGAPRYQLNYHTVGQSLALPIARRHGLSARALDVAERALAGESRELARAMERLEESRRHLDESREETLRERTELARARHAADELRADLEARKRQRWTTDLEESRRFLQDLERRGRELLESLRDKPDPERLRAFVRESREEVTTRAHDVEPATLAAGRIPRTGDHVEVAGSGIRGELLEVNGDRARIRRGGMRFEVPARQLRVVEAERPREQVVVQLAPIAEADEQGTQLDLTGLRVRDAVDTLATFLDRAVRTGAGEVRVVHGIGTGALRRAVHQFLSTSPYCAKFHEADMATGGSGVTIAELA
jgi:DNA mismatch repair protein MutS2